MVRSLLIRGMIAGALAGLLAFGFARIWGEPQVDLAIAFEEQMHKQEMAQKHAEHPDAKPQAEEEELVSRDIQRSIGLFTGVVVYASAFGGLFALVFAFAYGRIGNLSPRVTSVLLAAAAFVVLVLAPDIKYPPNPPSIGEPDTIGQRTLLFTTMIVASLASVLVALAVGRKLAAGLGTWDASLVAGAVFIVLVAIAQLLLPTVDEVPKDFPAAVLWRFRIVSIGIEAVLWTTIGLVFGALAERALTKDQRGHWSHQRA
jgi:predicted cobalt transporter CbtA